MFVGDCYLFIISGQSGDGDGYLFSFLSCTLFCFALFLLLFYRRAALARFALTPRSLHAKLKCPSSWSIVAGLTLFVRDFVLAHKFSVLVLDMELSIDCQFNTVILIPIPHAVTFPCFLYFSPSFAFTLQVFNFGGVVVVVVALCIRILLRVAQRAHNLFSKNVTIFRWFCGSTYLFILSSFINCKQFVSFVFFLLCGYTDVENKKENNRWLCEMGLYVFTADSLESIRTDVCTVCMYVQCLYRHVKVSVCLCVLRS